MWVAEIWRYPVKSMGGERLESAELRADGIAGDRIVHVHDDRGRVLTSRTKSALLGLHATLGPRGEPLIDGRPWQDASVAADVRRAAGETAVLERYEGVDRFDVLPLLVATDGAIAAFEHDGRRLRPNLVIGGVEGMGEREWEGRELRIGGVTIGVQDLRQRCIMTTFDPDTQAQDVTVLHGINRRFGGKLALNCRVLAAGTICEGDDVELG